MSEYNVGADLARAAAAMTGMGITSKMVITYLLKKIDEKQPKEVCKVTREACKDHFDAGGKRFDKLDQKIDTISDKLNDIAIQVAKNA